MVVVVAVKVMVVTSSDVTLVRAAMKPKADGCGWIVRITIQIRDQGSGIKIRIAKAASADAPTFWRQQCSNAASSFRAEIKQEWMGDEPPKENRRDDSRVLTLCFCAGSTALTTSAEPICPSSTLFAFFVWSGVPRFQGALNR